MSFRCLAFRNIKGELRLSDSHDDTGPELGLWASAALKVVVNTVAKGPQ